MYVLLKTYKHCLLNSINIIEQTLKLSGLTFDSKEIQLSITIKVQMTRGTGRRFRNGYEKGSVGFEDD